MSATAPPPALVEALRPRYLIERELGRGGMATVYLARDLKHDRYVALKVLHPELAATLGPERFLREIKVAARLQHPHILTVHDSGEVSSAIGAAPLLWFSMPYVEGESLRSRLAREKQLPVEEAVGLTREVAGALDYAHRHGVVHRDIKPENILLHDGQAFVADFGIALAVRKAAGERLTETGLSLGTPQYMSPEQATGERELDGRSDVYSLGCVLYESLAGQPPYTGPSAQAIVVKLLAEEPPALRLLRKMVPAHIEAATHRAIAKLPADRWSTAAEFAEALAILKSSDSAGAGVLSPISGAAIARPRPITLSARVRSRIWPAVALIAAALAAWRWWPRAHQLPPAPVRFALSLPVSEGPLDNGHLEFSPDGRSIVYVGRRGKSSALYFRPLDSLHARALPGTEGARMPFFSPDGRWVAFFAGDELRKIALDERGSVTLADSLGSRVQFPVGGAWAPNGTVVIGSLRGLYRVPATGGTPERITAIDTARHELQHGPLRILPDGRTVVFYIDVAGGAENDRLGVASLDAQGYATLQVKNGRTPLGLVGDKLIFGRGDGTIAAMTFDQRHRRVTGTPIPLLTDVRTWATGIAASMADDGSLVYIKGPSLSRVLFVDEHGNTSGGVEGSRQYATPRFSPDGRHVAVSITEHGEGGSAIWVYDVGSQTLSRLPTQGAYSRAPEWTPDGRHVAYVSATGGKWEPWWVPADGSGSEERLYTTDSYTNPIRSIVFSPDGRYVILGSPRLGTRFDLWLLPFDGSASERRATPMLQSPTSESMARVSPDGRWLAYVSDETGQPEVYIRPFRRQGGRTQVTAGGGGEPVWAPDGRRLFYRTAERFMAATLTTSPGLAVVRRDELFTDQFRSGDPFAPEYDVSPDGKRLAVLQPTEEVPEVVVVLNWLIELRPRLAASKSTVPP
jgi:eukaryotic-like serine/threonine-protein kinase